jgi:hypothetical protein
VSALLLALLVCVHHAPAPVLVPVQSGIVKRYDPGVMDTVIRNRTNPEHWAYMPGLVVLPTPTVAGHASRVACGHIGQTFWLTVRGGPMRVYQQVDCSDPTQREQAYGRYESDADRHLREGLIAELDYESAEREGYAYEGVATGTVWGLRP